ncbi:ER membrane protein complex subunit 10 [Entomortierella chlamydospora]|uniref:ER membrane protein complex subunit 10 n=1 Tax=Entomortierella chlamydospora TaxID=101097 RepID=A0A9P6MNK9_9FUNG|nr:ER membrane protein complex subunit 10 [Entomortierella chlamydospora]KAG0007764.1 ER membrane protein complex subunit 10 [Entomortierella chlamydospora]
MKLSTYILALTLAASVQVLAEEVTLGVWHKLSDHESFEKRGEIRFDADEWHNQIQIKREQANAPPTSRSSKQNKQKQQQQQQPLQPFASYQNVQLNDAAIATLAEDFVLNVQAPVKFEEPEPEPTDRLVFEDGEVETDEEFEQRMDEWKMRQEEYEEMLQIKRTPGSYAFYQIKLTDESRGWEAMSSIKSCLLVASDFKEEITLHLDQDHRVFAFDYYTAVSKCENDHKNEYPLKSLDQFNSVKIDVATSEEGPKAHFVKAQAIKMDQTGKPEAEKTFLQKYWMYIVPVVLVMMLTGGEPEKTAA